MLERTSKEISRVPAHELVTMEARTFEEAIRNDFDLDIKESEKITRGYASQVYKAHLGNEIVYILINGNPGLFPVEIAGYDAFKKLGIPTPRIIAYQEHPATITHPTLILSAAEGIEISEAGLSQEQEVGMYEQIGDLLKKVHAVKLDGYGPLEVSYGRLKGRFNSWQDSWFFLEENFKKDTASIRDNSLLTLEEIHKFEEVYWQLGSIHIERASLLHMDMHSAHVFVSGDQITGIIDLGSLKAGDPRYDIAMSLVFQTTTQQEAFKRGYGKLAYDPLVNKYLLFIAGKKIGFRSRVGNEEGMKVAINAFRKTLQVL